MKKIIIFLLLLSPFVSFAQVSRAQYEADIDATIYTNGTHKITAVADNALRKVQAVSYWNMVTDGIPITGLVGATGISIGTNTVTHTYTVTNTSPNQTVTVSAGSNISIGGSYPSYSVTNTAPNQTVTISGATGTYPSYTVATSQWQTATSPTTAITYTVGNVGVGTMSVTQTMELFRANNDTNQLKITYTPSGLSTNGGAGILLETDGGVGKTFITRNSSAQANPDFLHISESEKIKFTVNSVDAVNISNTGYVGFGTPNPASQVDVEGNISIGASYSGTTAAPTNGAIIEGLVGIGTNNPNANSKLHVVSGTANNEEAVIIEKTTATLGDVILQIKSNFADGYDAILSLKNTHTGGLEWQALSTNNGNGAFGGGKFVIVESNTGTLARLAIDANGVGIGTASPATWLQVVNTNTAIPTFQAVGSTSVTVHYDGSITENTLTRNSNSFTTTAATDTVVISGASTGDFYYVQKVGTGGTTTLLDILEVEAISTGLVVHRTGGVGSTSGMSYNWFRRK